ncbi:Trp repressor protein [compost metagenome]
MTNDDIWTQSLPKQFAEVLARVDTASSMQDLLRDLMTEKEIIEISARLEAARMLKSGKKYTEVTGVTKLSSRTIARISGWLNEGTGGYESAFKIIDAHHDHISPARD